MTITPGPELDAAVAKAIGLRGEICYDDGNPKLTAFRVTYGDYNDFFGIVDGFPQQRRFDFAWLPSTDLNAAFEAAEKMGLFEESAAGGHGGSLTMDFNEWAIFVNGQDDSLGEQTSLQKTPALAICAAILALSKTRA